MDNRWKNRLKSFKRIIKIKKKQKIRLTMLV